MLIKNKIIHDTVLLTVMQLILDSASLLMNSFITRQLGGSAMGILSLMGAFLGLAGILSNGNAFLCTSRLISEELGRENGNPNRVLLHGIQLCLFLSAAVSAVIIVFAEPVSTRFFSGAQMTQAVRLMPAALVTGAVSSCLKGYFNACRRAGAAAAGDIVEFVVKSAVLAVMTLASRTPDETAVCRIMILSIIAGNVSSMLFLLCAFAGLHRRYEGKGTVSLRRYISLAVPIMSGGILTSVLSSTNDALIPMCLRQYGDSVADALSQFGVFEAIVIPTLFFPSVMLCSMSGIIVSETARASAAGNRERIRSMTSRLIHITLAYAIFAAAVLMRFGVPIGLLLGGDESAGKMISVIAPVVPFIYMEIVLEALIKGMGLQAFSSLNYLAEYVIRIAIVLIFVPRIGFYGIAASYYASNVFGNTMRLFKILRTTGVNFLPIKTLGMPMLYSVMTLEAVKLLFRIAGADLSRLPALIIFTVLWAGMYAGMEYGLLNLSKNNTTSIMQNESLCKIAKS